PYCRVGRLLCLMRTVSAACPIYEAHSDDQGLTWSKPCPTRAVGVDPCLLELSDGRLAFSWGTRLWDNSGRRTNPPGQAPTFKLCLSSDGGQHWTEPLEIPQVSPSTGIGSNTGYSALAELEPGHLLMAYDVGSFGDKRHLIAVRDVIIEPLTGGPITSNNLQRSQEINFQHCCNSNRNT
ncbi:MAG: exo-alpha-sialidase, partial [Planctomycetes bacterium]|nr:exo-alpha-sialidase [Planctomycetota bacterium]